MNVVLYLQCVLYLETHVDSTLAKQEFEERKQKETHPITPLQTNITYTY